MKHSNAQLMNLPDDIIILILNKLNNAEVLYSLMNVNRRLSQILSDPSFTTKISLIKANNHTLTLPDQWLDRFCLQILPKIYQKIKYFNLELASMERILRAADYPNLSQLDIIIIDKTPKLNISDERVVNIFRNQILILSVDGIKDYTDYITMNERANMFSYILTLCVNILHLKFYPLTDFISFHSQSLSFYSNVVELHVNVYLFDDCLYLLDGRLKQLRKLCVTVFHIFPLRSTFNSEEKLVNLKYFSLTSISETSDYDEVLVPHLRRMSHLEELTLCLVIERQQRFIDGNNLKNDIINNMPQLKEFIFNIRSIISLNNVIELPSKEDIQNTLTSLVDRQVISCVDYFSNEKVGQCHFYTYPYILRTYENITNNFPGGLFKYVERITIFDERSFDHSFFIRIAQSFPSLQELSVTNLKAQTQKLNEYGEHFPIIEYSHLAILRLIDIHDDYVDQFLFDNKTYFSNPISLIIDYNQLQRCTHNFTRDSTRVNCTKVKRLRIENRLNLPEHFNDYFPNVK